MNKTARQITIGAAIAALYVIFTLIANAFGLANYAVQVRFSEALTVLPYYTIAAVPGLFAGCLISNMLTGAMALDVVFGSVATLIGAAGTYLIKAKLSDNKYLAPLPPILSNTIIVPLILSYVYQFEGSIPYFCLTVGIGEVISCGILGIILMNVIKKYNLEKFF